MTIIDVVTVRGTGEILDAPTNILRNVTKELDHDRFRLLADCPYPATVGPVGGRVDGLSERANIEIGMNSLAAVIRATPNQVGIIGYSLGALVVDGFMEAKARGEYADCEVAFTACLANPARREGDSVDSGSHGYGINGPHGDFPAGHVHLEYANPGDAITSCAAGSPLRAIADGMGAFGFIELGGWSQDLVDRLLRRRFQPINWDWWRNPVQTWQLYNEAARQVVGYLDGSQHIRAYIEGGYCHRMAEAINELVR